MTDLQSLRADPRAERDGVWIDCGHIVPGLEIRTRAMGPRYFDANRLHEAAAKRNPKNRQPNGDLKAEVQQRANMQALLDTCFVDVRGVTAGGEPVSADTFKEMLLSQDYRDIGPAAYFAAGLATEMKAVDHEDARGN